MLETYGLNNGHVNFCEIENIFMIDSWPRVVRMKSLLVKACVFAKKTTIRDWKQEAFKQDSYNEIEFYEILARVVDL